MFFWNQIHRSATIKIFEKYNQKLIKKKLHGNWFLWNQVPLIKKIKKLKINK